MKRILLATAVATLLLLVSCKKESTEPAVYRPSYGVPSLTIVTDHSAPVTTKEERVPCTIKFFKEESTTPVFTETAKIHIRGNATAGYPKKPYKIRFDEKVSVCGFPENKDWVLLALYCDHSLIRECYVHKLAEKVGLPYQIHHQHVAVTLNGESLGIYLLVDQVERATSRIDIDDDGFIIERDAYYSREPLNFMTPHGNPFTFKYPDAEHQKIVEGDEEYNFIKKYVSDFETALYSSDYKDPEKGYRKYIDAESWAKWYLVMELSGNMDTNHYMVLRNHGSKLERGPAWDAEMSFGLAASGANGWATPSEGIKPTVDGSYRRHWTYYPQIFSDPYFVGLVKKEWDKLKPQMSSIHSEMSEFAKTLNKAQSYNFKIWPILNEYTSVGLVYFGDWQKEVDYVDNFLTEHTKWFDPWLQAKQSI